MAIQFSCSCGKPFSVRDEVAGRRAKCPDCGAMIRVPMATTSQGAAGANVIAPPPPGMVAPPPAAMVAAPPPGFPQHPIGGPPMPPPVGYAHPGMVAAPPMNLAAAPVKPASKLFYVGVIATMMCLALSVTAVFITTLVREMMPPLLLHLVFLLPLVVIAVVHARLIYRMWDSIQDGYTPISPAKAVGMLFVPFYNFYWVFRALYGFAGEYNRYLDRHRLSVPRMGGGLFMTYAVLCIVSAVPVLGIVATPVAVFIMIAMIGSMVDAINALARPQASPKVSGYIPATLALLILAGACTWITYGEGDRMVRRWASGTFRPESVDTTGMPTSGPANPALTYDVVNANPGAYRGQRVKWPAYPTQGRGKRMIVVVGRDEYMGERDEPARRYAVDFASSSEMSDAFMSDAMLDNSAITGTFAGNVSVEIKTHLSGGLNTSTFEVMPLLVFPEVHPRSVGASNNWPKPSAWETPRAKVLNESVESEKSPRHSPGGESAKPEVDPPNVSRSEPPSGK